MLLLIAPIILVIIWNGLHGKGYKVAFKATPLNTNKGKAIRVLMFVYGAVLLVVVFISRYKESTSEGYQGSSRIISVVVFFLIIIALNIVMRRRRNK
jgi:Ca2+/H+ antiporter